MAAVSIDGSQELAYRLPNSTRNVVRASGGGLYAIGIDTIADPEAIAVWYSSDGSSWAEKDAANRPVSQFGVNGTLGGVSVAIDSNDKIHIFFRDSDNGTYDYTTFATATDQWNAGAAAAITTVASEIDGPVDKSGLLVAITVDSADKAHVVWVDSDAVHGTSYDTIMYSNNVSGWKAGVQIEGYTAEKNCRYPDITVNGSDIPLVVYLNDTDDDITAAKGNANDAATWTLKDVDESTLSGSNNTPSIAVDSDGDAWIAYIDSDNTVDIAEQSVNWTDAWTITSNGNAGQNPSLAVNGTDIYVFYEDDNNDIVYDKYTGSWAGETPLEEGTYAQVKSRWAYCNNYSYASVGIDYVFRAAGDYMYWNSLSIAAPPAYVPKVIGPF